VRVNSGVLSLVSVPGLNDLLMVGLWFRITIGGCGKRSELDGIIAKDFE
jgi:hypothetical protein